MAERIICKMEVTLRSKAGVVRVSWQCGNPAKFILTDMLYPKGIPLCGLHAYLVKNKEDLKQIKKEGESI